MVGLLRNIIQYLQYFENMKFYLHAFLYAISISVMISNAGIYYTTESFSFMENCGIMLTPKGMVSTLDSICAKAHKIMV